MSKALTVLQVMMMAAQYSTWLVFKLAPKRHSHPPPFSLAGHDDGSIRLWNLETGTAVDLVQHTNSVTCLVMAQVSQLDQLLFSAGKPPAVIGLALFLTLVCDDSVDKPPAVIGLALFLTLVCDDSVDKPPAVIGLALFLTLVRDDSIDKPPAVIGLDDLNPVIHSILELWLTMH